MTLPRDPGDDTPGDSDDPVQRKDIVSGLIYAALFASVFVALAWLIPAAALQFSPQGTHIEITHSTVEEVDGIHVLSLDYTAREKHPVELRITLFRERTDSEANKVVQEWALDGFTQTGSNTVAIRLQPDRPLKPGVYYYRVTANVHLGYNVERTVQHQTDRYRVSENGTSLAGQPTVVPG